MNISIYFKIIDGTYQLVNMLKLKMVTIAVAVILPSLSLLLQTRNILNTKTNTRNTLRLR